MEVYSSKWIYFIAKFSRGPRFQPPPELGLGLKVFDTPTLYIRRCAVKWLFCVSISKRSRSISWVSFANCLSLTGIARTWNSISLTRIVAVVTWMASMHSVYFRWTLHLVIQTLSSPSIEPRIRVCSEIFRFETVSCFTLVYLVGEPLWSELPILPCCWTTNGA